MEILQQAGGWPSAVREARLACEQLTGGYGEAVAGGAFYQLAELHRLHGEFADAEQAYRDAVRHGWDAQPGMALLRLAQGRQDAATGAIQRALTEQTDVLRRARLLPAAVETLRHGWKSRVLTRPLPTRRSGTTDFPVVVSQDF